MPADLVRTALYFTAPSRVEVREEALDGPIEGQVLVRTLLSAISPGTEMLVYRGQIPAEMVLDASIASLSGAARYPFKYGYSSVGQVVQLGPGVDPSWLGRCVFAFHPHESHYTASPHDLLPLPEGVAAQDAVFLPNVETAVNFVMDGRPMIGETVAVFGLGVVGLLTTTLLAAFPLGGLAAFDRLSQRREAANGAASLLLDLTGEGAEARVREWLAEHGAPDGFDLIYELSGSPAALDQAIGLTGFAGRVVIGSWYGTKQASLNLGGSFHRSRARLVSSQVSTIAPELTGRWDKPRRMSAAWEQLKRIQPSRWITHRFPIAHSAETFALIDQHPEETIQVVLDYT